MLDGLHKEIATKFKKKNPYIVYDPDRKVEAVSSGSVIVDSVAGAGGLMVKGRLSEIFGLESSGKTTLCLQSCANAQQKGWVGIFLDPEQTFDAWYAKQLGISLDRKTFDVFQPSSAEETEQILDLALSKYKIDYVVIDSIAAAQPEELLEKGSSDVTVALHARFMSKWFKKLQSQAIKHNIAILCTNQMRKAPSMGGMYQAKAVKDPGIGAGFSNDDSWVTTGGFAKNFYYSMRFLVQQVKKIKEEVDFENGVEEIEVGNWSRIKNVKNKISIPFRQADFFIRFGKGTDDLLPLFESLKAFGKITNKGANLSYKALDESLSFTAFGRAKFMEKFKQPEIQEDARLQYLKILEAKNRIILGEVEEEIALHQEEEELIEEEVTNNEVPDDDELMSDEEL